MRILTTAALAALLAGPLPALAPRDAAHAQAAAGTQYVVGVSGMT